MVLNEFFFQIMNDKYLKIIFPVDENCKGILCAFVPLIHQYAYGWEYCLREHTPFYTRIILSEGERPQNDDDDHCISYAGKACASRVQKQECLYLTYTIYTSTVHKRPSNHLYKPEPVYVSISSELVASESISERSTKRTLNTPRSYPLSSTHVFAFTPVVPPVLEKFKSASSVLKLQCPPTIVCMRTNESSN